MDKEIINKTQQPKTEFELNFIKDGFSFLALFIRGVNVTHYSLSELLALLLLAEYLHPKGLEGAQSFSVFSSQRYTSTTSFHAKGILKI